MEKEYSKGRLSTTNELNLGVKLVKCYICNIALYGAENLTLREEGKKYLEIFELWCWRRMRKISWTDRVKK